MAIVNDVAEKFVYGHPEVRFNDGLEEIPYLSCGVTEGSCVDINTYLIACLRAAGFEAGYMTGYFFPEEKNGCCDDMHCWVVTRHNGVVLEWDIAHHLKMGTREICCGLNPKPGSRVAMAHSMGLDFPQPGHQGCQADRRAPLDQRRRHAGADRARYPHAENAAGCDRSSRLGFAASRSAEDHLLLREALRRPDPGIGEKRGARDWKP
ncbi:transglutaminase-like domain-containing protein [uncultured Roseibium sp.]|uniref:transglutaminase-like domain-containing protein n=1 Tax=uncultured Roseibium sp. TaxID=1936171 RepID=UPI00321775B3